MAVVMIKCAVTGRAVSTGIELDPDTFDALPNVRSRLNCPACGNDHLWTKDDAWIDGEDKGSPTR